MSNNEDLRRLTALISKFIPDREGRDLRWTFMFREGRRWTRLRAVQYDGAFFFSGSNFDSFSCPDARDIDPALRKRIPAWLRELARWKSAVSRDPIEAQARLLKAAPLGERTGVIGRRNVRRLLPSWMPLASELRAGERKEILELLQDPPRRARASMTLHAFLRYCSAAYQANPATFRRLGFESGLSGRAYYKKYADGRHGGLLDLPRHSAPAFEAWYKSKSWSGCHPWEIYRGGNSTHIDMYITPAAGGHKGWEVHLNAPSSTRLIETCRIARALRRARLPVLVDEAQSYIDRLLDQDWIGVVPQDDDIAYAWQRFPQEWGVRDCVRMDWLRKQTTMDGRLLNQRLRRLVHWLPEDITAFLRASPPLQGWRMRSRRSETPKSADPASR